MFYTDFDRNVFNVYIVAIATCSIGFTASGDQDALPSLALVTCCAEHAFFSIKMQSTVLALWQVIVNLIPSH